MKPSALALILCLATQAAQAGSVVNLGTITASTAAALPSCLRPMVVGVCIWYDLVDITYSIKIGHRNPDLVVSATNGLGNNPWAEANLAYSPIEAAGASIAVTASGGTLVGNLGGVETGSNSAPAKNQGYGRKPNVSYREAQAIGHPWAGAFYCPASAKIFTPYYLSGLDAVGWRWQLPELIYPQALVPGLREIGSWPANTWGPVYPRSGWVTQAEQPKAAAVAAQRAADIVTRPGQPHIYYSLPSDGVFFGTNQAGQYMMAWNPPSIMEGDDKTGDWQMLAPNFGVQCEAFGTNDTLSVTGWGGGNLATDGNYAWALWRPYTCCEVKGILIGYIDIITYP